MAKKNTKVNVDIREFNILYDNVFVKGINISVRDGIYRPAQYEDKPEIGEVINIGNGRLLENGTTVPLAVKIGDVVYFNKYSSTKFNFDGEDYYIVREEDIVAFTRK